ncbi:MAG: RNA polymerase subunit sigma-70 [SAR86 cluster bacterium]|uniref:RNA polymerase subunit sigma-70 n=1 Tax=SAR86 cluster bacterium TaxID=2030880 RepID=A0A2A4X065_9GAMM|nr:MAG: RNA polymerase subunit sigma-70 [SAR86 cluster bacterium]
MISESALILRALARHDNDAFSALVRMHQGKIRAYLVRLCRSYDLADDIAQETFLTAFRKLQSYKGEGNFSGWLFRIAHNCFLQHIRKTKRRIEITEQFGTQQELQTEQYDSLSTEQMDLEQALTQLNPDETATITLCHSYGYSHQEVSDILDMPLGSVKSNISRGKVKLQKILTKPNGLEKAS